jgi:ligand-binding sensor domain-containing protein
MSQEYEVKFRSCLRLVVLLIFIFGTRPIAALNPDRLISQYIRRIFTTADGLGQNTVVSIIQTRDGYMWFGTQEGLARYNGYRFTNFRRKYTPGFISDYINDLYEDRRGFLWIATRGGLIRSQSNRFFPITLDQGLPSDIVYTLAEGPSGRLWIGTDRGLCSYSNGKITNQNWSLHLRINALKCSPAGTLWMGTDHGLYRRTGRDWIHLTDPRSIGDASISAIATESEGGLWAGTSDGSLYHLDQMGHITISSPRIS